LAASAFALAVGFSLYATAVAHEKPDAPGEVVVKDGESIPRSLTGVAGDPAAGRAVAIDRKKGNCLACHVLPIPEQSFHGEIGPDLSDVASRLSEGELRLRVVDPKVVNDDTIMPSFYKVDGFHRVLKKFEGKTVLGPQDVEDVIAYLMTLK
jgi:sulfur-oxidizing protein SoxX